MVPVDLLACGGCQLSQHAEHTVQLAEAVSSCNMQHRGHSPASARLHSALAVHHGHKGPYVAESLYAGLTSEGPALRSCQQGAAKRVIIEGEAGVDVNLWCFRRWAAFAGFLALLALGSRNFGRLVLRIGFKLHLLICCDE